MNPLRAITYKITSVMLFIIMATLIKTVSVDVPAGQSVFFRSLFAMPVIIVWMATTGHLRDGLKTAQPMGHLWRGVVGTAAMGLGFTALGLLALPEVTAISYAAPLFTVILAALFLGERVRAFRLTAVAIGLVGVVIVLSPRLTIVAGVTSAGETLGAILALTGAVFMAIAQVIVRRLTQTESTSAIVFYFSLTASVLSLQTIWFGWVWPTQVQAVMLIAAGVVGGIAQIFLTQAFRYAPTGVVGPFEYTSMLFALVIGYTIFGEVPTLTMLAGAALVVFAGLLVIWRERQLGIRRRTSRQVMTPQG